MQQMVTRMCSALSLACAFVFTVFGGTYPELDCTVSTLGTSAHVSVRVSDLGTDATTCNVRYGIGRVGENVPIETSLTQTADTAETQTFTVPQLVPGVSYDLTILAVNSKRMETTRTFCIRATNGICLVPNASNLPAEAEGFSSYYTSFVDACAAAANTEEKLIVVFPGTYNVTSHYTIPDGLTIRGVIYGDEKPLLSCGTKKLTVGAGTTIYGISIHNKDGGSGMVTINANAVLDTCDFTECTGFHANFITLASGGGQTLRRCVFKDNTANSNTNNRFILSEGNGNVLIEDCSFINNNIPGSWGAFVYFAGSETTGTITVSRSRFIGNSVGSSAILNLATPGCEIEVSNCLFVDNSISPNAGSVISLSDAIDAQIINCTCLLGSGTIKTGNGGLGVNNTGTTKLANSIFYGFNGGNGNDVLIKKNRVLYSYANCIKSVYYNSGCTFANDTDRFNDDPLLNEDYTLGEGSPCLDKGTRENWAVTYYDLAGNPRKSGRRIDIGCFEKQVPPPPEGTVLIVR